VIRQFLGKGFDDLEHLGDFAFVIGEHDALGQHIGNHQKPFRQHVPQLNRPTRLDLILILGLAGQRHDRGFLLETREPAADPRLQLFQKSGFIFRRKADQHRDAITKQHGNAGFADPDRERHRRKRSAFEAHGIDPVADMQGVRGHPCSHVGGNEFGPGHQVACSGKRGCRPPGRASRFHLAAAETIYHRVSPRPKRQPRSFRTLRSITLQIARPHVSLNESRERLFRGVVGFSHLMETLK
jgi:hypothetical protein